MMNNTNINYNELCTKLRSMKMSGMAEAFEKQLANPNSSLRSFDERISEIITAEWDMRYSKKFNLDIPMRRSRLSGEMETVCPAAENRNLC